MFNGRNILNVSLALRNIYRTLLSWMPFDIFYTFHPTFNTRC